MHNNLQLQTSDFVDVALGRDHCHGSSETLIYQWRQLHEHKYTFVPPCILKTNTFIEKLTPRSFKWYMTLLYRHIIYHWKALKTNFSIKLCPPDFDQWVPLIY